MAALLTPSQLAELQDVFKAYDTSGEGLIDYKELGVMLRAMGLYCTEAEVQDMIVLVDTDGSGKLDFPEFVNLLTSRCGLQRESLGGPPLRSCERRRMQAEGHGRGRRGGGVLCTVRRGR